MLRTVAIFLLVAILSLPNFAEAAFVNVRFSGQDSGYIGLTYVGGGYQIPSGLEAVQGNATIEVGDSLAIGVMSDVKAASLDFGRLSSFNHSGFQWQYSSSPPDGLQDIGWAQTWDYTGQFSSDELIISATNYYKWRNDDGTEGSTVAAELKLTFAFETSTFLLYGMGDYSLSDFGNYLTFGKYELVVPTGPTSRARYTGLLTSFDAEEARAVSEPSSISMSLSGILLVFLLGGGSRGLRSRYVG